MLCPPAGVERGGDGKPLETGCDTHTLEKVAPWSAISGCFSVCISPLDEYLALDLTKRNEVQSPLN